MKPMNWSRGFLGGLSIGVLAISGAMRVAAQELPKVYDASVPRERQIALAESAAPTEVSSKATVYILGLKGFEKVREGTNGFSCYVGRHFVNPTETTVEPTCFDAEGSRTTMIVRLREEELRSSGKSEAEAEAVAKMKEAVVIEDSIDDLSQPPYPVIPAHELFGTLLIELNRPADAREQFEQALKRTPNRPKLIYGLAQTAQATGDRREAQKRYEEFLALWKNADPDIPILKQAKIAYAKLQ